MTNTTWKSETLNVVSRRELKNYQVTVPQKTLPPNQEIIPAYPYIEIISNTIKVIAKSNQRQGAAGNEIHVSEKIAKLLEGATTCNYRESTESAYRSFVKRKDLVGRVAKWSFILTVICAIWDGAIKLGEDKLVEF